MEAGQFVQAMGVGLSIAAPVGPIGLLVIQRTIAQGVPAGLATGMGAAVADGCWGAAGAYGVALLIDALQQARVPLAVFGGGFLLWLAWRTWLGAAVKAGPRGVDAGSGPPATASGLMRAFGGTFVLTLSNPATILSFIAVFGALAGRRASASPAWMVLGVLAGSALWWLLLCTALGMGRRLIGEPERRLISRASALLLAAFALWQWAAAIRA
jgi:threonine/homoserine/homoserine lactone efflux protein